MDSQFSSSLYKGLRQNEIRIIVIKPNDFQSPIVLNISHTKLVPDVNAHGNPSYQQTGESTIGPFNFEALSYSWGTQSPSVSIAVNGVPFGVSPNLESILRYLRYSDAERAIWVDAICINQNDRTEKMSQLPLMHEIYSQARTVIIWLGDPTAESNLAMQYIREVHAPIEPGKEDQISDAVAPKNWPLSFLGNAPLSLEGVESLTAFYKLLRRPWWYRAWIVQEMGLARAITVQCGKEKVTFAQMKAALQITRRIHPAFVLYTEVVRRSIAEDPSLEADWHSDAINNALNLEYCRRMILQRNANIHDTTAKNPSANQASWSFWSTRARLCRTPHDRAFSLLGIAGKDFRDHFVSTYEETEEEHYRNTVRGFVKATKSLDVILHSQHSIWTPQCSSWAPDWSQPERAGVFHLNEQILEEPLPFLDGDVVIPKGTNAMQAKGCILGKISRNKLEIGHLVAAEAQVNVDTMPVTASASNTGMVSQRRRWWVFKEEFENGQMFHDALARLPSADPLWKMHLELFLVAFVAMFHDGTSSLLPERWRYQVLPLAEERQFKELELFWDLLEYLLIGRTICEMADGRLVVAPDFSEAGDCVAVLSGCSNAVVLRSRGSDEGFSFLGDAWVLGFRHAGDRQGLVDIHMY